MTTFEQKQAATMAIEALRDAYEPSLALTFPEHCTRAVALLDAALAALAAAGVKPAERKG